jgi:CTP:molybdopterin cytidylyltransferase MocA
MGQPKHMLRAEGGTFLEKVLGLAREAGCDPLVCVVAAGDADLVESRNDAAVRVVVNPDPVRGMVSSLREGLNSLADVPGVFVFPVDHPYISPVTVRLLGECVAGQPDTVVKPEYLGHGGHPVYIPAALFGRVKSAGMDASLRTIISESGIRVVRILVTDEGVAHNVNTPDDVK